MLFCVCFSFFYACCIFIHFRFDDNKKKLLYASRISGRDEINLDDFDAQSRQVRSNCFVKHNQKRETWLKNYYVFIICSSFSSLEVCCPIHVLDQIYTELISYFPTPFLCCFCCLANLSLRFFLRFFFTHRLFMIISPVASFILPLISNIMK